MYVNICLMRNIIFYETSSGQKPIEDFLEKIPPKEAQKVAWVLKLIEELDVVPGHYFKKLVNTNDIWEVRIIFGTNIFRLLGFFDGPKLVVLSHAFQKKTQKTPRQAIKIAEERKHDYFKRRKKK